jgi:non-specific protein-tyrosine kinase
MEILGYWKIIRKRLWFIILLMLIAGAGAGYYGEQQPVLYSTTTTLFLNPAARSPLLPYQAVQTSNQMESLANTYSEYMRTRSFAHLVVQDLGLPISEVAAQRALSTAYVANTQFFRITAIHSDPQTAQGLANTAAEVLIAENTARRRIEQQQLEAQHNPDFQRLVDLRVTLQNELALYNERIASLQSQLNDLQGSPQSATAGQQIGDLQERLVQLQELRSSNLTALNQTQTALANSAPAASPAANPVAVVVDAASLPTVPLASKTVTFVLLALVASLAVAAGLSVLWEYLDYTVKTPEVLEMIYGMPAQGVIGVSSGVQAHDKRGAMLVTLSEPHSPEAEAFRVLRTGVVVASLHTPVHSLLITSAKPGEGKSFVAANLAVSYAQNGNRVILVDADLRKPSLHRIFDLPLAPGFSNLVINHQEEVANMIRPTAVQNLWVLTCGIIPPNPVELLGSPRAAQVMVQLEDYADIVIYDSPPAATVTDAAVLASQMDAVLQVVLAGRTRIDLVRRCKTLLEKVETHIIGPVLNQAKQTDIESYAHTYSYYHEQSKSAGILNWRRLFAGRQGSRQTSASNPVANADQYASGHE